MAFRQKLILKPLLQTRTQIRSAERPATTPKSQPSIQSATKRSISSPIWSIFPAAPRPQAPIAEKFRMELSLTATKAAAGGQSAARSADPGIGCLGPETRAAIGRDNGQSVHGRVPA